jgi:hypothetical protein
MFFDFLACDLVIAGVGPIIDLDIDHARVAQRLLPFDEQARTKSETRHDLLVERLWKLRAPRDL